MIDTGRSAGFLAMAVLADSEVQHPQEQLFKDFLLANALATDAAHDIGHIQRVTANAKKIGVLENANMEVVIPAAWLHDCVFIAKNSGARQRASSLSAEMAANFLNTLDFDSKLIDEIYHAIEAHSFSANITPRTIEAKIVQDADRLDALGAVGISRCLLTGGNLGQQLYEPDDPFCENREPDDKHYTLDHFYNKLFKLYEQLHTESARQEAKQRMEFMKTFVNQLRQEIS